LDDGALEATSGTGVEKEEPKWEPTPSKYSTASRQGPAIDMLGGGLQAALLKRKQKTDESEEVK